MKDEELSKMARDYHDASLAYKNADEIHTAAMNDRSKCQTRMDNAALALKRRVGVNIPVRLVPVDTWTIAITRYSETDIRVTLFNDEGLPL